MAQEEEEEERGYLPLFVVAVLACHSGIFCVLYLFRSASCFPFLSLSFLDNFFVYVYSMV